MLRLLRRSQATGMMIGVIPGDHAAALTGYATLRQKRSATDKRERGVCYILSWHEMCIEGSRLKTHLQRSRYKYCMHHLGTTSYDVSPELSRIGSI